jgi:hypothetical protein
MYKVLRVPNAQGMHPPVAGNYQFQPNFRDRRKRLSPARKHICDKSILTADDYPATSGCTHAQVLTNLLKNDNSGFLELSLIMKIFFLVLPRIYPPVAGSQQFQLCFLPRIYIRCDPATGGSTRYL